MERKIGEQFTCREYSCIVRENDVEVNGWLPRGRLDCNSRCVFWNGRNCEGLLSITGDCQSVWREDKRNVFFEDADLARSPLGAAAANSEKIVGKDKAINEEKITLYKSVIKKWGIDAQLFMVMEECGELLSVLSKAKRNRSSRAEIITELADVSIMIEQLTVFYGEKEFAIEKERKLQRLKKQLANSMND